MLSRSQRPLTPRAPTPLDAVIRTRLDQRSMDDQQQRDAERGRAQRRCRFEADTTQACSEVGRPPSVSEPRAQITRKGQAGALDHDLRAAVTA